MTNGKKIKVMFPSMKVGFITDSQIGIYFVKNQHNAVVFSLNWWNAEYEEPVTRDDTIKDESKPTAANGISNKSIIYKAKESKDIQEDLKKLEQLNESKNDLTVDCISRKAVLDLPKQTMKNYFGEVIGEVVYVKDIMELPPVTSTRPKGHWVYDYTSADGHKTYHCSECGCYLQPKHSEPLDSFKWCSLCGADMRNNTKHKGTPIEGNNESYNCENWIP